MLLNSSSRERKLPFHKFSPIQEKKLDPQNYFSGKNIYFCKIIPFQDEIESLNGLFKREIDSFYEITPYFMLIIL